MSGDVQPRKRKDKKKKKDEGLDEAITQQQQHHPAASTPPTDDINIHVHKDSGTGGGICAKFVFFILLGALAVIIGLIITEHRGLTDLDTIATESRFSDIFAGWIDNSVSHSNDEHLVDHSEQDEDEDEEPDSLEDEASEEQNDDEGSEEQDGSEADDEDEDEEDEDESDNTQEDEDDEDVSEAEPASVQQSEEADDDDDEISKENSENEDDDEENESKDDENEADDDVESEEQPQSDEADNKDDSDEKDNEEAANDASEEKTGEDALPEDEEREEEALTDDGQQLGLSGIAVKFGVGVAILVVAYVVLVRKWKSVSSERPDDTIRETITPDLTRRNTIVAPPSLEEVEPDMENVEEDYSDEEEEDQGSDDDSGRKPSAAKVKYRELQSTYSKSLTPEKEPREALPADDYEYYEREDDDAEEDEESVDDEEEEEEDDIEDISEDDDVGNDDDDELLKKLEAKYGKLQRRDYEEEDDEQLGSWKRVDAPDDEAERESDSDTDRNYQRRSGAQSVYDYANNTNSDDWLIREDLDRAEREIRDNTAFALTLFATILEQHPSSPRALYGKARSLDQLAEIKKSNELLRQSISVYWQILKLPDVPDALFQAAGQRCANRMQFSGRYGQAIAIYNLLIERFPDVRKYKNQLAVIYLTINKIPQARKVLQQMLTKWPNDGFALVHYGFILKTTDNKLKESVYYLKKGLSTKDEGVIDGRFYFHLGDALTRLGRHSEAEQVYEEGVKEKVFLSKYQRSLYNVASLTGRPWWRKEQTPYQKFYETLEFKWKDIRKEGLDVLSKDGYFKDESENLKDVGNWKQFELFARGVKNVENCRRCPITCRIIEEFPEAKGCKRGQTKFSVMHPGTHVWPHCGPTNCRLRIHLGLVVPGGTYIRVAEETKTWEEGKVLVFDDSFEHEVWHNGTDFRLVLIVDVWHPELTPAEKRALSPI